MTNKNDFEEQSVVMEEKPIEHLTHQSHIMQIRRLPEKRQTLLEKFIVLFNQAWCTDHKFILDLQNIPEEFKDIARRLKYIIINTNFLRAFAPPRLKKDF
jgi:hypothetical protein